MPNFPLEGHNIEIAGDDEIPPDARKPVTFNIENGQSFGVDLPVHQAKSTLFKFHLDGTNLPDNEYLILQPPAAQRTHGINMAEMRPMRLPTPDISDYEHQLRLFNVIGSVTVAGGHVEMAMKKVLVSLQNQHRNLMDRTVPGDWDNLEKDLWKLCEIPTSDVLIRLKELLQSTKDDDLREQRNDVIHGYWWTVAAHNRLINARYYRPKKSGSQQPVRIQTTLQAVQDIATKLFELAGKLDALVTPDWPIAIFPTAEAARKLTEDNA
jgi:hypothetical protein